MNDLAETFLGHVSARLDIPILYKSNSTYGIDPASTSTGLDTTLGSHWGRIEMYRCWNRSPRTSGPRAADLPRI